MYLYAQGYIAHPMKKQSDLAQWFGHQYVTSVGIANQEGSTKYKHFVDNFPVRSESDAFPYPLTGMRRNMNNFLIMRMKYPLGPNGYTCLALRAGSGSAGILFAFAYWRRGEELHKNKAPEYICISPTFESQDGEYRSRFIHYSTFSGTYEKYASDLAAYEGATLGMIEAGSLDIEHHVFPADDADSIARYADGSRLAIMAFTVCLALDLRAGSSGWLPAHTNSAYVNLMRSVAESHPSLALAETRGSAASVWTKMFTRGANDNLASACGQKLVPMTLRETMQPFDCNLSVWRELLVMQLTSDLVVNFITPSTALYNQWSYIEEAGRGLFENRAMLERYTRSHASDKVMTLLRAARKELSDIKTADYHVTELGAYIYESLEYAQSNLTLSDTAMLHISENVGWTFRSLGVNIRHAEVIVPELAGAVADIDSAAKLMFELAYGSHCNHTKIGVVNADLHSNNFTVHRCGVTRPPVTKASPNPEAFYDDPMVMYITGPRGEADSFIFPATGVIGCIIDFSRCILGPGFQKYLVEGRTTQYAINFYRDQTNRVMRTLHRYAPDYVSTNQDVIKAAVIANFEAVFHALCAVDFISIGASIAAVLRDEDGIVDKTGLRPFVIADGVIELAEKLEEAGREALIAGLHAIVHGSATPPPFPGTTILHRVFRDWLFSSHDAARMRNAQLVDAYNFNNELRYSGRDYEHFPPWGRFDEIERHLGQFKMTDVFERGIEPFLEAMTIGPRVQIIAERTRAAQEKLDGKPVSTASSWIEG